MDRMDGLTVEGCRRCPALVESRTCIVNGAGPPDAAIALVGEAPGAEEDDQGAPFVGRSGEVLEDTLAAVGLTRKSVRIINSVRCRPPDNRNPTADELSNCYPYLEQEIVSVDPAVIVVLGKVPAENLLARSVGVTEEGGTVVEVEIRGQRYPVVISVHPAATLYDPSQQSVLEAALTEAATLGGVADPAGQRRLEEF